MGAVSILSSELTIYNIDPGLLQCAYENLMPTHFLTIPGSQCREVVYALELFSRDEYFN